MAGFSVMVLIMLYEICAVAEQLLFKKSVNNAGYGEISGFKGYCSFLMKFLRNPMIWCGFFVIVCAWVIWFIVLANVDLSFAVPFNSLQYVLVMVMSFVVLKERIDTQKIIGGILILIGISLIALN